MSSSSLMQAQQTHKKLEEFAKYCNDQHYYQVGNIQNFGMMFVMESDFNIVYISDNTEVIGIPAYDLLSVNFLSQVAEEDHPHFTEAASLLFSTQTDYSTARVYIPWQWHSNMSVHTKKAEGLLFRSGNLLCLEAMLPGAVHTRPHHYAAKACISAEIASFKGELEDFADLLCRHIRSLTGFDRVFCIRFEEEASGRVIGESLNEIYPSLYDHHFPASDVPVNIREVYKRNRFRHMPARNHQLVPILDTSGVIKQLDLSLSLLREVGQTHIEYLANMQVESSLSFSIIINNELWGLLGAHKHVPTQLSLQAVLDISELTDQFAIKINTLLEQKERRQIDNLLYQILELSLAYESADCDLEVFARQNAAALIQMTQADNIGWINGQASGVTCNLSDLELAILTTFIQEKTQKETLFTTDCLVKYNINFSSFAGTVSGILALKINTDEILFWIRPEQFHQRKWGGNPEEAITRDTQGKTGPRKSFATWMQNVRYTSLKWELSNAKVVRQLGDSLIRVKAEHARRLITQNALLHNEIEERKAIEKKLRETNKQLESFAYIASHDLQEPLRMITNYCQLLEKRYGSTLEAKALEYLHYTTQSAHKMRLLIDSILEYSRLDNTILELHPIDLNDILAEVRIILAQYIRDKKSTLNVVHPLPVIHGDKTQIYQLLQNLILNALKFHEPGNQPVVSVHVTATDTMWQIGIEDNGIGIATSMQDKIFEMFQRLNPNEFTGTGLGLTLCRKIVELHGGKLWFESEPGKGSIFYFTLPFN